MQNEFVDPAGDAAVSVIQDAHRTPSASGLLALWVGPELCSAYHSLDKQARARVRTKVKSIFRDVLHHENPSVAASQADELTEAGIRANARGIAGAIITVLREKKAYTSVMDITAAVQKDYPSVSAYTVRRVCNRCAQAAQPIMLKGSIPNPSPVKQGNRERVDAFKLTPEMQRRRKQGSVVRDGMVVDTIRDRILQIIAKSDEPVTALDIKRALQMPSLTMDNLYSYLSTLKAEGEIKVCDKKPGGSRRVNAYVLNQCNEEAESCPPQ